MIDVLSLFAKYSDADEYLKFERVENPPTQRPDLCAFMLLDRLLPSSHKKDLICSAEHDQIWLSVTTEDLALVATEADILMLVRCGVFLDSYEHAMTMFV